MNTTLITLGQILEEDYPSVITWRGGMPPSVVVQSEHTRTTSRLMAFCSAQLVRKPPLQSFCSLVQITAILYK